MSASKVRIAKDKAELVKSLVVGEGSDGVFPTYADAIAFAAALGSKRQRRSPLSSFSQRDPGAISVEIFISRGYDTLINLLAIVSTKNPKIISPKDPAAETQRLQIFEEYANGGLEILRDELRGSVDYTERITLLLLSDRHRRDESGQYGFDLSRFL